MPSRKTRSFTLIIILLLCPVARWLNAQDDVTTQNGTSAIDGGWITGPASNPLSFLNGPAYRTYGSKAPYDFRDFRPISAVDTKLPQWVNFEIEERIRCEEYRNGGLQNGNDDRYVLNRFRAQLDLQANSWSKLVLQVQDARPFLQKPPVGPPNENRWDLKTAYAEFGNPEKHWISLRVGRQLINYNNTLMANSEWRNQGRSFDAAVANLHGGRYRLAVFAASAVLPLSSGISHHQQGNNIYGLYGRIESLIPHSSLEPFVLWRVQPAVSLEPAVSSAKGKQDMKVFGLRLKGRLRNALDYSSEFALEGGSDGPERIRAWATSDGVAHEFGSAKMHPRVFVQYDFASGAHDPGSGVHRTFDAVYPTAHDRFGILDLFGWQNIQSQRVGGTLTLHRRWTVTAQYLDFWAADSHEVIYNSSGGVLGIGNAAMRNHIGHEGDAYTWFELNRHLNIGAGFGYFGRGNFFSNVTTGHFDSSSYFVINFKDNGGRE